jgi:tungstate transport system substrate-binding protein
MRIRGLILLVACSGIFGAPPPRLKLSTTTSTQDSGILDVLLPPFQKKCYCQVNVVAVGTGKALKLGESGDVDVVLVHARPLEDQFVAAGFGVNRRDVMYNDFVIIGPPNDPAGIGGVKTAVEAFKRIAAAQVPFISRGDDSGTHQTELELWRRAGLEPQGRWYRSVGQGMGQTIIMATELRGYTISDRGTYMKFRQGKTDLKILFEHEAGLFNPYGVIAVNPKKFPWVQYDLARQFIDFLTGADGQALIAAYRVAGEPVFFVRGMK